MAEKIYAGITVSVNEEGFFLDKNQWKKEMAIEIAQEDGIPELTEGHWKVLNFLQKYYAEHETMPTMRRVNQVGGIPTKELYALFPGGPLKKSSRMAGLPKPASCI